MNKRMSDVETVVEELEADGKATAEAVAAFKTEIDSLKASQGTVITADQIARLEAVHSDLVAAVTPTAA